LDNQDRIKRLLNYKTLLNQLQNLGFVKVFSDNIADALGVSASLVRKDFAIFGIAGSQKGGYEIASIVSKINDILGKNKVQKVVLVGVGRLGTAFLQFGKGFHNEGIKVVAAFDINPEKVDETKEIPVLPMPKLSEFIQENDIKFAIVTVPEAAGRQTIELLMSENIRGILNFTSLKIKSTDKTIINNVDIEHELARLIYNVNQLYNED
jgi:redox-sensing transcriptional repressor